MQISSWTPSTCAYCACCKANGRATYDEVAAAVSLSPSATLRRVKRLEDAGVIAGYVALVKPEAVGLSLTAYITVRLEKHSETHKRKPMDAFRASVQTWPDVVECSSLTGEMDYLLRVLVSDMAALLALRDGHAAQAPERAGLQDQLRARSREADDGGAAAGDEDALAAAAIRRARGATFPSTRSTRRRSPAW